MPDDPGLARWLDESVWPTTSSDGLPDRFRPFFQQLFADAGPVDGVAAWTAFELAQIATTEEALRLVLDDVAHFWDREPSIAVDSFDAAIRVTVDGGYRHPSVDIVPGDVAGAVVELVRYLRDELDDDDAVHWPACSRHDWGGLDAAIVDGGAVWLCRHGDHILAPIGQLRNLDT